MILVLLEVGLRVVGLWDTYSLFVLVEDDARFMAASPDVALRYFRPSTVPTIPFDAFRADRDTGDVLIVLQGGSSAAGYPYYFGSGIADDLETRLQTRHPDRRVEVVNTAMAAVNSFTLLDLAPEIAAIDPDLVIIYAGHNEYYGALGVGSRESSNQFSWIGRLYLRARRLALTQNLEKIVGYLAYAFGERQDHDGGTLMARMVEEPAIALGSSSYYAGLQQFEANVSRLLRYYWKKEIPVVISTIASNLRDQLPLGSSPGMDARDLELLVDSASHQDWQLPKQIEFDSTSADAVFVRARWMLRRNLVDHSRRQFELARDLDQLRFRAPAEMNVVIRRLARQHGSHIADVKKAIDEKSHYGIPGNELFADHLHPNIPGYAVAVETIIQAVAATGVLPDPTLEQHQGIHKSPVTALDSISGVYRVEQIRSNWPFTKRRDTYRTVTQSSAGGPIDQLAFRYFKNELTRYAALNELQLHYQSVGDHAKAVAVVDRVVDEFPFLSAPPLAAGQILLAQRNLERSFDYLQKALAVNESAEVLKLMGSIRLEQQRRTEGIDYLERSFRLNPDDSQTLYNLGGAYALTGRLVDARSILELLLTREPDYAPASVLLERVRALEMAQVKRKPSR